MASGDRAYKQGMCLHSITHTYVPLKLDFYLYPIHCYPLKMADFYYAAQCHASLVINKFILDYTNFHFYY